MVKIKSAYNPYTQKTPEKFLPKYDEVSEDRRMVHDSELSVADVDDLKGKKSIDRFRTNAVDYSKNVLRMSGLQNVLDRIYGANQLIGFVCACPVEKDGHVTKDPMFELEALGYLPLSPEELTPRGETKPLFPSERRYKSHVHVAMAVSYESYAARKAWENQKIQELTSTTPLKTLRENPKFAELEKTYDDRYEERATVQTY